MRNYKFTIRGNQYDVEIIDIDDNVAKIDVNGTQYTVDIHQQVKKSKTPTLVRERTLPSSESTLKTRKPTDTKGAGTIKAPLPGTIIEIKIKVGDTVKSGDNVLIMEAMKMENNIKATSDGVVKDIKVNVNDSVLEGDVLVEIGA